MYLAPACTLDWLVVCKYGRVGLDCEANCPVLVRVRCGTVVLKRSGTGGALWSGVGVSIGAVRYMFGMAGAECYNTLRYGIV